MKPTLTHKEPAFRSLPYLRPPQRHVDQVVQKSDDHEFMGGGRARMSVDNEHVYGSLERLARVRENSEDVWLAGVAVYHMLTGCSTDFPVVTRDITERVEGELAADRLSSYRGDARNGHHDYLVDVDRRMFWAVRQIMHRCYNSDDGEEAAMLVYKLLQTQFQVNLMENMYWDLELSNMYRDQNARLESQNAMNEVFRRLRPD